MTPKFLSHTLLSAGEPLYAWWGATLASMRIANRARGMSPNTMMSLRLDIIAPGGAELAHGTGFIVEHLDGQYLITNRHNVTGRDADNNYKNPDVSVMPGSLVINYQYKMFRGSQTHGFPEPLYDAGDQPLWFQHPEHGRQVDVVALPVNHDHTIDTFGSYDVVEQDPNESGALLIGDELFVIGFPYRLHREQGNFPTWIRGTVATEPSIDFRDLPCYLIDARTRGGMSGSPVIYHWSIGVGANMDAHFYPHTDELMGIYSGRVDNEADLGFVWKTTAIKEIIEGGVRPSDDDFRPSSPDVAA